MRKKLHLITSLLIVISMLAGNTAFASNITTVPGSSATSDVTLTSEVSQFSATVPTGLIVAVEGDGTIITATEAQILNNCHAPIYVSDVDLIPTNGWSLVEFDSAFYKMPVGKKVFGFQLNSENVSTEGKVDLDRSNWPVIYGYEGLDLDYDANLPAIKDKDAGYKKMADVIFTIDFWSTDSNISAPTKVNAEVPKQDLTAEQAQGIWEWVDSDTESGEITITKYNGPTGDDVSVTVPATIDGKKVTKIKGSTMGGAVCNQGGALLRDESSLNLAYLGIPSGITLEPYAFQCIDANKITVADDCTIDVNGLAAIRTANLVIGKNVTIKATSFDYYSNQNYITTGADITTLYIDSDVPENLCRYDNVSNIVFGENVDTIGKQAFGGYYDSYGNNEYTLSINSVKGLENVSTISDYAFSHHTSGWNYEGSIKGGNITIRDGATVGRAAFADCDFNNITIGKNVTLGMDAFERCTVNGTLTVGSGTDASASGVLGIYSANTVDIGKNVTYSRGTFINSCDGGSYDFPTITNFITDSDVPEELFWESNGKSADIANITFGANCTSIGKNAFCSAKKNMIQSIKGLANVKSIGDNAFRTGKHYIKSYVSDGTVLAENFPLIEIGTDASVGEYAFEFAKIDTVKINSGATLSRGTFDNNTINSLTIMGNVTFTEKAFDLSTINTLSIDSNIPAKAFMGCTISDVTLGKNVKEIGANGLTVKYKTIKNIAGIENVKHFGQECFAGYPTSVQSKYSALDLPDTAVITISKDAVIDKWAFKDLNVKTLNIGDGVSAGVLAFEFAKIENLVIGNNFTRDSTSFSDAKLTNVFVGKDFTYTESAFKNATITVRED